MAEKKKNTAEAVREIAQPVAEQLGLQLWDVVFEKEGPDWHLRIIIDKPGGIFIDDCEAMSRAVDPIIDELDPTDHEYILEVSSPGLSRVLKTDQHLAAYNGERVLVRLIRPDDNNRRDFAGILKQYTAETVTITDEELGEDIVISRKAAAYIKAGDDDYLKGKK